MKPINELMYLKVKRHIHTLEEVMALFEAAVVDCGYEIARGVSKSKVYGGYIIDHSSKKIRGIASPHTFYTCNHREATVYEAIDSIRHHSQEKQMKPRPHADLIKAWADGAEIQVKARGDGGFIWTDLGTPGWHEDNEYRIKPENKVYYVAVAYFKENVPSYLACFEPDDASYKHVKPDLKLVMDDKGKLISAEVL